MDDEHHVRYRHQQGQKVSHSVINAPTISANDKTPTPGTPYYADTTLRRLRRQEYRKWRERLIVMSSIEYGSRKDKEIGYQYKIY